LLGGRAMPPYRSGPVAKGLRQAPGFPRGLP